MSVSESATATVGVGEVAIRDAVIGDLAAVREIYNHYVVHSTSTFEETPWTDAQWHEKFELVASLGLPFLTAETADGVILGYAYVGPFRPKSAYRYTAENSIYLAPDGGGRGVGRSLLETLVARGRDAGLRQIVAVISDVGADASIALHRKLGFVETGHLRDVGYKFDQWLGTVLLQKQL